MGICDACIGYILIAFITSPLILQCFGVFGTDWVTAKSCEELDDEPSCCKRSSNWSSTCKGPFGLGDLHRGVYTMQWIAFFILVTPIGCGLLDICCSDKDDDSYEAGACAYLGGFCFLFYPIAGVLSFIGCMIIAGVYSGQSFGLSFRVCLASGLYVLIITGILIFLLHLKGKRKAGNQGTVIQRDESIGTAAPYGGVTHVTQCTTVEETGVVHDPESGGFIAFARRINVYHQLTHWS